MTMPPGGFPFGGGVPGGMPGAPGAAPPGYAQQPQQGAQWVLDIPADPNWQPFETTDTLAQDGFYMCKIVDEKVRDDNGKISIIMTLEIQDPDAAGKKISRFLDDPRLTKGDTWWKWRGLLRSLDPTGRVESGQINFRYTPGMFKGYPVYVKTGAYFDDKGSMRTGVDNWTTRPEYEEAAKAGGTKFRWQPNPPQRGGAGGGAGALPAGLPASFAGLPGAPVNPGGMPMPPAGGGFPPAPGGGFPPPPQAQTGFPPPPATATPQPTGMPMQQAPQSASGFPPAPQQQPGFAPPPSGFAAPPPQQPAAAPAGAPGQTGFGFPPAPTNGTSTPQPPPTAAGLASSFPFPPRQ